jgi:TonB-linked SusC/RagA family outer membrane protein
VLATVVVAAFAVLPAVAQQTGTVSGMVTEAGSGDPLPGVQLFVAGETGGAGRIVAISGDDGRYTLNNVPVGQVQVRARLVGYSSRSANLTLTAGQTADVNFQLSRSVIALDEIVVSGAGGQTEKKQLGNTIATIDAAAIGQQSSVSSFSEALSAREPSVVGLPSSGLAGEGARIRIRGTNSLSISNEPVVYVDGVRIDGGGGFDMNVGAGGGGTPSRLDDINPEFIERIEILKGAAAATLYGSEASSGVIQIFTKQGSRGAPRFSFRIDQGISRFPDVYKPNAGFARTQEQADRLNTLYGISVSPYEVFERTFVDDLFETGRQQIYSGSVTGGTDEIQYAIAGRFTHEDGAFGGRDLGPANDTDRKYQANASVTLFPRDRLSFRFGGLFTDSKHTTPNNNNNIYGTLSLAMFGKPELGFCDDGVSGYYGSTPICNSTGNPTGQAAFMTVRESMQQVTQQDAEHFNGNMTATYQAATSLSLETTFGIDVTNGRSFEYAPFGYDVDEFTGNQTDGFRNIGTRNHRELSLDSKLRWSERFGDMFSSDFTFGGQGFISRDEQAGGSGTVFPGPGLEVAGAAANQSITEQSIEVVNVGGYAQEQFGINDWVFLTGGLRLDRNSAFGETEGVAIYPKASISIIPSDLSFWDSRLLSTFRIRAAWGRSGLQPGAFDKFTTFIPGPTSVGAGLQPGNLGNEDLAPEKSTEIEMGAEFGLIDNRIALELTYWDRRTADALINRQFPVSGGFTQQQLDNIGQLDAHGLEIKGDWLALDRENLSLSLFANASYLSEVITDMGPAPPLKVGGSYPRYRNSLVEGYAPGAYFGPKLVSFTPGSTVPYDTNGDDQPDSEAEFRSWLSGQTDGISLDDLNPMLADEDGDGDLLDHYDGKPTPDWQGAFGANITLWQNVQVNTLFEYKTGNFTISNLTDAFRQANASIGRNFREAAEVESALLNPNSDEQQRFDAAMAWATELRALTPYDGLNQQEDGKFLRWRELGVTYSAPSSFASRLGLSNMAFSVAARNLHIWTPYSGIDPEQNGIGRCGNGGGTAVTTDCNFLDGIDAFGFPLPRRYTFSVRFGF